MISYKPFFETIKRKGISQYSLEKDFGLSRGTITSLRENRNMNLLSIEDLCNMLDCEPYEIFEFVKEEDNLKSE